MAAERLAPLLAGKGAFGAVFLVFKKDTGMAMAVKKMKKKIGKQNSAPPPEQTRAAPRAKSLHPSWRERGVARPIRPPLWRDAPHLREPLPCSRAEMLKDILIEREVLSKVSSRFCVGLHYAWQNDDDVALVITLMPGGDLEYMMKGREEKGEYQAMSNDMIKYYVASMALGTTDPPLLPLSPSPRLPHRDAPVPRGTGLEEIHKMGYVYRDLKPMNVLLDAEGQVRISDMGLTANITKGPIKQCSGTRGYWSPETVKKEPYQYEPDWWSLGVTIYVLWTRRSR